MLPSTDQANAVGSHDLWHRRLGHPSDQVLSLLFKNFKINDVGNKGPCDICFYAKQTRTPFVASDSHTKELFGLIYFDIWGGYKVPSFYGAQYFFTIVYDASRAVWVYLMREKGETSLLLQNFVTMEKTQFGEDVKIIRGDNELEFLSRPMQQFYQQTGLSIKPLV